MRNLDDVKDIVEDVRSYLISRYGDGILQVIVYGSFARGDANEDSDIDVAVIVSNDLDPGSVEAGLNDLLFDILLERQELVSVLAIPENLILEYRSPFLINVKREGVAV